MGDDGRRRRRRAYSPTAQDPLADVVAAMTCAESRQKQYHDARVPLIVSVTVTVDTVEHVMRVVSTSRKGAKLMIELTTDNLDVYGYANPPPPTATTNDERYRRQNDERRMATTTTTPTHDLGASSARRRSSC